MSPARQNRKYRRHSSMFRRWLAFNLVGALGVLIQLTALAVFTGWIGLNYLVATAAAVETAVLHNFVWHERWTWAERVGGGGAGAFRRMVRFHATNGVLSVLGNLVLMRLFVGGLGMNCTIANLAAITLCSLANFFSGDRLVFVPGPAIKKECKRCRSHEVREATLQEGICEQTNRL